MWGAFGAFVVAMLLVDLALFGGRGAAFWSIGWTGLGLAFAGFLWAWRGGEPAGEYLAGFLIEKSLSVDNLFVFALIFGYLGVPARWQRRVLFWGIVGAIVLRGLLGRFLPMTVGYSGDRLIVREAGRRFATPMLAALVLVATFDVVFAVDSIPAIFAVTRETFIVYAANAFSLLGLAALYFVLAGMLGRFRFLNVGLAA